MWACTLIPSLAATAVRLTMRLNPGGVRGAPRFDTADEMREIIRRKLVEEGLLPPPVEH